MLDHLNIPRQQEKVRGKYTNMYLFCDKFYLKKKNEKNPEHLTVKWSYYLCFFIVRFVSISTKIIISSYPQHIFIANLLKLVPEIQYAHGYRIICCMGANLTLW